MPVSVLAGQRLSTPPIPNPPRATSPGLELTIAVQVLIEGVKEGKPGNTWTATTSAWNLQKSHPQRALSSIWGHHLPLCTDLPSSPLQNSDWSMQVFNHWKKSLTFWAIWPSWDLPQQLDSHEQYGTLGPGGSYNVTEGEDKGPLNAGQQEPSPASGLISDNGGCVPYYANSSCGRNNHHCHSFIRMYHVFKARDIPSQYCYKALNHPLTFQSTFNSIKHSL